MRSITRRLLLVIAAVSIPVLVTTAQPPGFGGPGFPGFGPGRDDRELIAQFDDDQDGILNSAERKRAREYQPTERAGGGRGGPRGFGGFGDGGPEPSPGPKVAIGDAKTFPDAGLYDIDVLRTIFLDFETEDWEAEMADFYRTDVEVPAKMTVDGKTYGDVGVGFRGNSSYFTVAAGHKRSLSISIDAKHKDQTLYGYQKLNLLNSHADPSFLRETLFSFVAGHYTPTYKVNLVKVVINGQSWGIYVNSQQFNKDFTRDYFDTRKGVRWKVPAGRGGGPLAYLGGDRSAYESGFQLKSSDVADGAWSNLIELCRRLEETPVEKIDTELDDILNIDRALWFLALDNTFIDGDGYISRGSDYSLYQDPLIRFHLLHYDSNETFRFAGGGGPGARLPGVGAFLDPLVLADDETRDIAERPVLQKLLANPRLRMRYIAHVRTIVDDWLSWDSIGPVIEKLTAMIDAEVKADTRKLHAYSDFASGGGDARGAPTLQGFIDQRQLYLLTHEEITKPHPRIEHVTAHVAGGQASTSDHVTVTAQVTGEVGIDKVILYFAERAAVPFQHVEMHDDGQHADAAGSDGTFGASIPPFPAGSLVHYYVEARSDRDTGTTVFSPPNTEMGSATYGVKATHAASTPIVINELVASNTNGMRDPQGELEDWIELKNLTDAAINASGMYLTDSSDKPRKWRFPDGTVIPANGHLVVWADEDGKAKNGLHASFKLSKGGESIWLIDADERQNAILDALDFPKLRSDVAFGRIPDGTGEPQFCMPTAGASNRP